jgi:small subunit ribosomal protein S16
MLKLRLSRGGTKKRPVYKVVVADSRFARDGRFIEKVGFFNPLLPKEKKERIGLEAERIKYWLGQGAQPTTRVARILGENELMPMPANGNNPQKAVPKKDRKKEGSEEAPKAKQHQQQQLKRKKLLKQKQHQQQQLKRKKLLKRKQHQQQQLKRKKLLKQKQHQQQKLKRKKLLKQKLKRKKLLKRKKNNKVCLCFKLKYLLFIQKFFLDLYLKVFTEKLCLINCGT